MSICSTCGTRDIKMFRLNKTWDWQTGKDVVSQGWSFRNGRVRTATAIHEEPVTPPIRSIPEKAVDSTKLPLRKQVSKLAPW